MIRAAACGAVDFSRADPSDRLWWKNLGLRLDALERTGLVAYYTLHSQRVAALLGRDDLTKESTDKLQDEFERLAGRIKRRLFPWIDQGKEKDGERRSATSKMEAQWARIWGDPNSEETKAKIAATARWLMENDLTKTRPRRANHATPNPNPAASRPKAVPKGRPRGRRRA